MTEHLNACHTLPIVVHEGQLRPHGVEGRRDGGGDRASKGSDNEPCDGGRGCFVLSSVRRAHERIVDPHSHVHFNDVLYERQHVATIEGGRSTLAHNVGTDVKDGWSISGLKDTHAIANRHFDNRRGKGRDGTRPWRWIQGIVDCEISMVYEAGGQGRLPDATADVGRPLPRRPLRPAPIDLLNGLLDLDGVGEGLGDATG